MVFIHLPTQEAHLELSYHPIKDPSVYHPKKDTQILLPC